MEELSGRQLARVFIDALRMAFTATDRLVLRALFCPRRKRRRLTLASTMTRLGNGPVYVILLPLPLIFMGADGLRLVVIALGNIAAAHSIYPVLKRHVRRSRPFEMDPSFSLPTKPMDKHSFPSGHVMTLAAASAPFLYSDRSFWLPCGIALILMSWARLACAHHYLSDVAGGIAIGFGLGSVVPLFAMSI